MRVGLTGHQQRSGIDWDWTLDTLARELESLGSPIEGWSMLAVGADQIFAEIVLELGGTIVTVVPGPWYEHCFDGATLPAYRDLLGRGEIVTLAEAQGDDGFRAGGLKVVDSTEMLIAVWDGQPGDGRGGTGDIVEYALSVGRPVIHLQPIDRTVERLG